MAHLTAQARLKLVGFIFLSSEPNKDPFPSNLRSHHRRPKRAFNSSRICSSTSSSSANKGASFRSETRWNVGDESVYGDSEDFEDDSEDDDDDGDNDLNCFRGLVLDIAYRPINVVCWKRAICLEYMEKADVLEYYDQTVSSPSGDFCIPAVLRVRHLLQVVKRRRIKSNLSRKNLLLRDSFTCQYCCSPNNLTIDHVVPVARGGQRTWENLVTACAKCNAVKGHKTLEETNMKLIKVPKAPKDYDIIAIPLTTSAINMLKMRGTPQEWRQYLP